MADPDPLNVDWGRVYAQAVAIAITISHRNAEDVVQEGMKLLFAGEAPWDSAGETSLPEHLVAEGRKALENKERTERTRAGGGLHIVDCGSTNGTAVDGLALGTNKPRALKGGEAIAIGRFAFVLQTADRLPQYVSERGG